MEAALKDEDLILQEKSTFKTMFTWNHITSYMKTVGRSEEMAVCGFSYWAHLEREKELATYGAHELYLHVYLCLLRQTLCISWLSMLLFSADF